jgi:hypothetical protein
MPCWHWTAFVRAGGYMGWWSTTTPNAEVGCGLRRGSGAQGYDISSNCWKLICLDRPALMETRFPSTRGYLLSTKRFLDLCNAVGSSCTRCIERRNCCRDGTLRVSGLRYDGKMGFRFSNKVLYYMYNPCSCGLIAVYSFVQSPRTYFHRTRDRDCHHASWLIDRPWRLAVPIMVTSEPFRVIVVGGGPVGLTAAHALGQAGIDFVVLESRDTVTPQSGASLVLKPSTLRVFQQLGLEAATRAVSCSFQNLSFVTPEGKLYHEGRPGLHSERM